jgi:hypothetical protein
MIAGLRDVLRRIELWSKPTKDASDPIVHAPHELSYGFPEGWRSLVEGYVHNEL